jgi:hypothetical protein
MSHDIYSILKRFDSVAEGQDANQKSVPQLPALFKPREISPVLGAPEKQHPTHDYFVGGEGKDVAKEDVVTKDRKSLGDYFQSVADAIKKDPDLIDKVAQGHDVVGPAVKTITTDDGHEIKIHGNEDDGFRITVRNRPMKSTFKSLDEAHMACEMFRSRRQQLANQSADYVEERT